MRKMGAFFGCTQDVVAVWKIRPKSHRVMRPVEGNFAPSDFCDGTPPGRERGKLFGFFWIPGKISTKIEKMLVRKFEEQQKWRFDSEKRGEMFQDGYITIKYN